MRTVTRGDLRDRISQVIDVLQARSVGFVPDEVEQHLAPFSDGELAERLARDAWALHRSYNAKKEAS